MDWCLIITFFILIILEMKNECVKMYLFAFSDHTLLKTRNICTQSTPGQNPKALYANSEIQTDLNEENVRNIKIN